MSGAKHTPTPRGEEPPCPITRRPYFMHIEHPELGDVPTYGGPFDSYTVPEPDEDGHFRSEHYCHDRGDWIEGGNPEGLMLITEREHNALLARVAELEPAAECWNALASCYRITCMGSAGLCEPKSSGYAHATFNLWTVKGSPPEGATGDAQDLQGRTMLGKFLGIAIANLPVKP